VVDRPLARKNHAPGEATSSLRASITLLSGNMWSHVDGHPQKLEVDPRVTLLEPERSLSGSLRAESN
jgi:hypothetical protein